MSESTNPVGAPPLYSDPADMQALINLYFETGAYLDPANKRDFAPTVSGLALFLGMSRKTLADYAKKPGFRNSIALAKARIEVALEQRLYGSNVNGVKFNLQNNFGWAEKTEQIATVEKVELDPEEYKRARRQMMDEDDC